MPFPSRLSTLAALLLLMAPAPATAALRLLVVDLAIEAIRVLSFRGDRLEVRLAPSAAARARSLWARDPLAVATRLGTPAIDHVAAALGVLAFEPEFPGEPAPARGAT